MKGDKLTDVDVDNRLKNLYGISLYDMGPDAYVGDLKIPVLYSQAQADNLTTDNDIKSIYDGTTSEKHLEWIEGHKPNFGGEYENRTDGYLYWTH